MKIKVILALLVMSLAPDLVHTQALRHPWSVADGGGGKSSGGGLNLSSSVGQPSIGVMSGTGFTLEAGYLPGVRQLSGTTSALNEPLFNGWNMLAVPFIAGDMRKTTLYPTATSFAYAYVGASYLRVDTLQTGVAYWMKFPPAQIVSLSGTAFAPETVIVVPGWNMIGSISWPALASSIIPVSTVQKSLYYGYGGSSYYSEDTLKPGLGYWIKVSAIGKLIITPASAMPPASASSVAESDQAKGAAKHSLADLVKVDGFQQLTVRGADAQERSLYFASAKKEIDVTQFELPPAPPSEVLDVRFASQRIVEMPDVKNGTVEEFPIRVSGGVFPIVISWDGVSRSDAVLEVHLAGQKVRDYPMNIQGSLVIQDEQLGTLKVRITSESKIDLPKEFALYQNFPNPFNPTTKIQYDLPIDARVSVKIYNLIGQEVMTLINDERPAGRYVAELNAGNLPSGVYYYRIEAAPKGGTAAQEFSMVRKLLLLK